MPEMQIIKFVNATIQVIKAGWPEKLKNFERNLITVTYFLFISTTL